MGRALSGRRRRHIRVIIEGRGVRRGVRLKFLATCRALLERKKRDHQAMVVAARPAAGLVVMTEVGGGRQPDTPFRG